MSEIEVDQQEDFVPPSLRELMIAQMINYWGDGSDHGRWLPVKELLTIYGGHVPETKYGRRFIKDMELNSAFIKIQVHLLPDTHLLALFTLTLRRFSQQR